MKKKKLMSVVATFSLLATSGLNPGIQFTDRQTYPPLALTASADEIVTPAENVVGASLILGGSLKVNIKFDGDISDHDNWTLNGQPFSTINKTTVYAVPAKDFMSDIVIQHGAEESVTFSVADLLAAYKASEKTKDIAEALENYCQAARTYFHNGTVADYSGSYERVKDEIGSHPVDMGDGYYASSLLLKSSTILRHYYTKEVTGSTAGQNGYYYIEETIPAHQYSSFGTANYCVNDYIYKALTNSDSDANLKNLCVALYNYGKAAMTYAMTPGNIDSDCDGICDTTEEKMHYSAYMNDTDGNGIPDGDEDYDGDGISNLDEINLGICPYAKDSDYDDINDYDELNIYNTDPDNEDTDGDGIIDGDELLLQTNLNSTVTNGVEDNKNTKEYQFSASSEQTEDFNADNQPFKFSFDIKAAGAVDQHVKVAETGYSYAISENPYIIGNSPCISYDDQMQVDNVSVYFAMQDGYNADISKYTVFYYWEGYNLLIPIETYYNESTKTVYAHNVFAGTYCLVNTDELLSAMKKKNTTQKKSNNPLLKATSSSNAEDNPYSLGATTTWNGHEYFLITSSTGMTYDDAVAACAQFGGYPVTITSADESEVVDSVADWSEFWLGASFEKPSLTTYNLIWITGEENTYESWGGQFFIAGISETDHVGCFWQLWRIKSEDTTLNAVVCERSPEDDPTVPYSGLTFTPNNGGLNPDPNADSDGDGIPDIQELSPYDKGTFGSNGYKPSAFSNYLNDAANAGMPVNGPVGDDMGNIGTPSYNSDPYKDDSDGDGYKDFEDGTPEEANEDLIEILQWSDDSTCRNDARRLKNYYYSKGKSCRIKSFSGYNSFYNAWKAIGDQGTFVTDKYYYNVTDVILDSHGINDGLCIALGKDQYLIPYTGDKTNSSTIYAIENMSACRRFESLDMLICFGDNIVPDYFSKSLAETFIQHFSSIKNVYAFDCACALENIDDVLVWEGVISRNGGISDYSHFSDDDTYAEIMDNILECFPDVAKYNGQVLYKRTNGTSYTKYSDLYYGRADIRFDIYFDLIIKTGWIGKPSLPNGFGFDPVMAG